MGVPVSIDEKALLSALPRERFTLLLKHQPAVDRNSLGLFDLQLSGHTHGGQIFPFGLLVRMAYRMRSGLTPLTPHGHLYVSRGAGTWGPRLRVLAAPEITLFEIESAEESQRLVIAQRESALTAAKAVLVKLEKMFAITGEQESSLRSLYLGGYASRMEWRDKEKELYATQRDLEAQKNRFSRPKTAWKKREKDRNPSNTNGISRSLQTWWIGKGPSLPRKGKPPRRGNGSSTIGSCPP